MNTIRQPMVEKLQRLLGLGTPLETRLRRVIDVESEAARLRVDARARSEGQRNQPAAAQSEPDAQERAITEDIRRQLGALRHAVAERFAACMRRGAALEERFTPARLEDCVREAEEGLDRLHSRSKIALGEARRTEREARRELEAFRSANRLDREARDALADWALALSLALAVLLDGAANAFFFAEGSDLGWLGGLYQALVVAAINVAVAVGAGIMARNLLHIDPLRRWCGGYLVAALYVAFLGFYTLLVAHLRAALQIDPQHAAILAWLRLTQIPLQIHDAMTVLLIICSVLFATVAFASGLLSADPYPGYSRVTARWKTRNARVQKLRAGYLAGIEAGTSPVLQALDARLSEAARARDSYRAVIGEARGLVADYDYAARRLEGLRLSLVQRYRRINSAVRDEPAPAYFGRDPEPLAMLAAPELDRAALARAEAVMHGFTSDAGDLKRLAAQAKAQIYALRKSARADADAYFAAAEAIPAATVVPAAALPKPEPTPPVRPRGNGAAEPAAGLLEFDVQ